jgi:APA family basic amino acid/polyamine antiporter
MSIALIVGTLVGAGAFLLPASLAPFGLNSIIGWAVTVSRAVLFAIVFARLSRRSRTVEKSKFTEEQIA